MRRSTVAITICAILMFFAVTSPAADTVAKSLTRTLDPLIATGDQTDLCGDPIAHYRLYAIQNKSLTPIPFQIDERDEKGNFILTDGGNPCPDEDNGRFDENDELVFMAEDTGDKLTDTAMLPESVTSAAELEMTDPLTDETAWAYLVTVDCPSDNRETEYVSYNPECQTISTPNYSVGFHKNYPAAPADYAFQQGVGGNGEDFLDRAKVRVTMGQMGVTLQRSEEDIKVKELGHLDGPIRVVVYSQTTTPLVLGIPASSTRQYTYYYRSFANFGFAAYFPLQPDKFRVTIIDDFRNSIGWTFYNSNNPDGVVIDGQMGPADKNLDLSPWDWSVLTNNQVSFWSRWRAVNEDCPVKASQYFNDDKHARDKQENHPGERPGIGFDFKNGWKEFDDDRIAFRLIHFFTRGYTPAMISEITRVHDAPLEISEEDVPVED